MRINYDKMNHQRMGLEEHQAVLPSVLAPLRKKGEKFDHSKNYAADLEFPGFLFSPVGAFLEGA